MNFNTKLIHSSYNIDDHNQAIMPPIYQNSIFALHNLNDKNCYKYSRISNPTRKILEDTICDLENGHKGFAFSSGMAAIDAVLRAVLEPKDTILAIKDLYGGTYDILTQVYSKWQIKVIFIDFQNIDDLINILKTQKIKALWLESPTNPLLNIVNINKICQIAIKNNIITIMDNTFSSPYLQNPINFGIDIVIHSATKYLSGHSDVLMGLVITKNNFYSEKLLDIQIKTGAIASPMDCFLTLRGIKTLAVRMQTHQANALQIAKKLEKHPKIKKVFYPGLKSNKFYSLANEQMRGFGGIISIYLKSNSIKSVNTFIKKLKYIKLASSLGGVESLINHSFSQSHNNIPDNIKKELGINISLLRISVGIEDVNDIWKDINNALSYI